MPALTMSLADIGVVDGPHASEFDNITDLAAELAQAPVALISIVEPENDRQFFTSAYGLPEPWRSRRQTPLSHSFCQHVRASGTPLIVDDSRLHPLVKDNAAVTDLNVVSYLGVPIHGVEGEPIGALCAIDGAPRTWPPAALENLKKLATFVDAQIQLRAALRLSGIRLNQLAAEVDARKEAEAQAQRLARTDFLTGVLNRRAFLERARIETARIGRHGGAFGLVLVDLDHFKSINDTHGHAGGDAALQAIAGRLHGTIRAEIDVVSRIGGEEFVLLLPDTDLAGARDTAERCRRAIEALEIILPGGVRTRLTASFGVSACDCGEMRIEDALAQSDAALYAAKAAGRNAVACHPSGADHAPAERASPRSLG